MPQDAVGRRRRGAVALAAVTAVLAVAGTFVVPPLLSDDAPLASAPPEDRAALMRRLDRADRVRTAGAVVCVAGALLLVG